MKRKRRKIAIFASLAVVITAGWHVASTPRLHQIVLSWTASKQAQKQTQSAIAPRPAPVAVARVERRTFPIYADAYGTVQPLATVTVRPQVEGKLVSVDFHEGQLVEAGHVLARLDSTIYEAQQKQTIAKLAQSQALLNHARLDLDRYRQLAKENAVPKQQADQQAAAVAQLEATIAADKAGIAVAETMLGYTTISAPISGRVGLRLLDSGNTVRTSDGIVSIAQLHPIAVIFTLPQRELDAVAAALRAGKVAVDLLNTGQEKRRGQLLAIDNSIEVASGTIRVKAIFENQDTRLWPGQFASVRVHVSELANSKIVPRTALKSGADGDMRFTYVYVVDPESRARIKRVTVLSEASEFAAIEGELQPGDAVVVQGFLQLSDGRSVRVVTPETAAQRLAN